MQRQPPRGRTATERGADQTSRRAGTEPTLHAPQAPPGDDRVVRLKLDLHDVWNRGEQIERALRDVLDEAERTHASVVEIIPGKGSGQLKKRVLRFLDRPEVKVRYHRVEKDSRNWGRLFVHFRWK